MSAIGRPSWRRPRSPANRIGSRYLSEQGSNRPSTRRRTGCTPSALYSWPPWRTKAMRIVIALGGNALLHRGERPDADVQEANIDRVTTAIAALALEHEIVVTHGNGPQIGLLAEESAADPALRSPYPLDLLGAQTQGMIGSLLVRALHDALPGHRIAALVTHTLVRAHDPAFGRPTKFVGQVYSRKIAESLARRHGWLIAKDGRGWRRVVPSPGDRDHPRTTGQPRTGPVRRRGRRPRHRRQRHRCADRRRCGRRQGPHGGSARRGPQGRLPAHPHRRPVRLRRLRHR